jgi:hypothetical protein
MKKILLSVLTMLIANQLCLAQVLFNVSVNNISKKPRTDVPVVINLEKYDKKAKSASITMNGQEIAYQMDDLDNDGKYDELCFLTDLDKNSKKTFKIMLSDTGTPKSFPSRVYVEMLLKHPKNKTQNKQNTYISSLTVDGKANPYECLQHHGPAFESELNAYRIYFDERQTVDIYGKYRKGLELKDTQFYPDKTQKENGYGDDILWVGSTMGLGTLRGWNGYKSLTLNDVTYRTEQIIARGPLRTIVEVKDEGWKTGNPDKEPINMTTRYTLYAGHRDCAVDIVFNKNISGYEFATGIINVKNSQEFSDNKGLRGCWGTDWPVSEKDSTGYKRETVGLGICIPTEYMKKELAKDTENFPFVISSMSNAIHYDITFCSDNESYGFHSSKEWFKYLKEWKEDLCNPVTITY